MKVRTYLIVLPTLLCMVPHVRADARTRLAQEAAEAVVAKFGSRAASKGLPALAARIESLASKHGNDVFQAVRRVGPQVFELVEAAGVNGSRAARLMARHGEAGATCILKRPRAMTQFLRLGEESAAVLVRHPGVAERSPGGTRHVCG